MQTCLDQTSSLGWLGEIPDIVLWLTWLSLRRESKVLLDLTMSDENVVLHDRVLLSCIEALGLLISKHRNVFMRQPFMREPAIICFEQTSAFQSQGALAEGEALGWSILPTERFMHVLCSTCALQSRKDCVKLATRRSENMAVIACATTLGTHAYGTP